jgi:replication factor C subunit 2/4
MNTNYSWVEKYRPNKLDDICSQSNIINSLKSVVVNKNIPHLIFFGPSGCGKTSTILALAKDLFGINNYMNRIIEFNASDERGINIVRDKIKNYAKQSVKVIDNIPPWKIIILDEADTMTMDSQFALRRIMEQYAKITRFCIICNYHNKIIDPIISRCSLCKFKSIEDSKIISKLQFICEKENISCTDIILNKIVKISRGDLRKAINLLQKCYTIEPNILYSSSNEKISILYNNINNDKYEDILHELSGLLPNSIFNNLIKHIWLKDTNKIDKLLNEIYINGYSIINQIILFHDYIITTDLSSEKKSKIMCKLAEIDQNLIKGCDEYIQFMNLIYFIMITI